MTTDKERITDAQKIDEYWPLVGAHRRAVREVSRLRAENEAMRKVVEAANDLNEDILGNSESIDDAGSYDVCLLIRLRNALAALDESTKENK